MQETEPLDIIIVRRGQRSTGEAYILLRMPIQVELVLRKDKTYIGKRYVEVNLAKKLVRASCHRNIGLVPGFLEIRLSGQVLMPLIAHHVSHALVVASVAQ